MRSSIPWVFALALLLPTTASADPIRLKFSFYTSDRSLIYQTMFKPFVEAVNRDGEGLIQIDVYFSGTLNKVQADDPKLLANGTADMAAITVGRVPSLFPDTSVIELPGLYRDQREASLVFNHLVETGALQGYGDYFVVGALVAGPENIHSRTPIASLKDLNGLTVRTNNYIQGDALKQFGARSVPLAINRTMDELSQGKIDAATFPPSVLFEFGVGRIVKYHYMLPLGNVPVALLMNRRKFEALPPAAQAIIRANSGKRLAENSAATFEKLDQANLERLKADPRREVVFPSASDLETARRAFASVIEEWAAQSPHNRELLRLVKAETAKLRSQK